MTATDLLIWGVIIHLFADFFLQNQWMNDNKANLRHPAGYVHAGIHAVAMLLIFPPLYALTIGLLHWWIDTRKPLAFWRRTFRQTTEGPAFIPFAMWQDQAAHILVIAVLVWPLR